jgi:hypothetical protein
MKPDTIRRIVIGLAEAGGGAYGAWITLISIRSAQNAVAFTVSWVMLAGFLATAVAGFQLLRGGRWGAPLLLGLKVPQLIGLNSPLVHVYWWSAASFAVSMGPARAPSFEAGLGAGRTIWVGAEGAPVIVSINIAAIIVIWQLVLLMKADRTAQLGATPDQA